MDTPRRFASFGDFYPFYLSEHRNPWCRRLHLAGTAVGALLFVGALAAQAWRALLLVPLLAYGFAWAGHFFFEHNRPATFQYPLWSLRGDLKMFADACLRRRPP